MTRILLPFYFLSLLSCGTSSNSSKLTLDEKDSTYAILTSRMNWERSESVTLKRCDFRIVINELHDTVYWETSDSKFLTPEGCHTGMALKDLESSVQKSVTSIPGWGYVANLKSGWNIAFCIGKSCTDSPPSSESIIGWIYKKDF